MISSSSSSSSSSPSSHRNPLAYLNPKEQKELMLQTMKHDIDGVLSDPLSSNLGEKTLADMRETSKLIQDYVRRMGMDHHHHKYHSKEDISPNDHENIEDDDLPLQQRLIINHHPYHPFEVRKRPRPVHWR